MKQITMILITAAWLISGHPAYAMEGHGEKSDSSHAGHDTAPMGFKHDAVVDGVHSEFQIMSLASMKMEDDTGKTHHIMVKLMDDKTRKEIKDAKGKIKIIDPDGTEQVADLKNYGSVFAANFTFAEKGKYGVICLLKIDGQKKVVKFWYKHHK